MGGEETLSQNTAPPGKSWLTAAWSQPILLLTLTTAIWGGHAVVGRLAVGQISPMTLTFLRWALALGPIFYAARSTRRSDFAIMRPRWIFVAAMGALGFTGFNALFYFSLHYTSAINVSIIQGVIPAFVLLGALGLGGRVTGLQGVGAVMTMLGVVAIAAQGEWARLLTLTFTFGDLLMLIACVFYAFYTLGLRNRPNISGFGFLSGMALAALLTSLPLFIAEVGSGQAVWPTWRGYALLIYAAMGPAFIAQLLYMRGVELIGPNRAGVFVNLVPVFGAVMSAALLGEPFAAYHVLALVLVVGGIAIAQRNP